MQLFILVLALLFIVIWLVLGASAWLEVAVLLAIAYLALRIAGSRRL